MEHLTLLQITAPTAGWTNRVLRNHGLRFQVHVPMYVGIVAVGWQGWRSGHVTHILRRHGPKHVRVYEKNDKNEDPVLSDTM